MGVRSRSLGVARWVHTSKSRVLRMTATIAITPARIVLCIGKNRHDAIYWPGSSSSSSVDGDCSTAAVDTTTPTNPPPCLLLLLLLLLGGCCGYCYHRDDDCPYWRRHTFIIRCRQIAKPQRSASRLTGDGVGERERERERERARKLRNLY